MYGVGSIINVKDICFKDEESKKRGQYDHASKKGRPCLVVAESMDYIYFLTFQSYSERKEKYNNLHLIEENHNMKKKSFINLASIYKESIKYHNDYGNLSDKEFLIVMKKLLDFQTHVQTDILFEEVYPLLSKEITKRTSSKQKSKR